MTLQCNSLSFGWVHAQKDPCDHVGTLKGVYPCRNHNWDYYTGVLSLKSSHCNSAEDQAPVDFIYGCLIFNWVVVTWQGWEGTWMIAPAMDTRVKVTCPIVKCCESVVVSHCHITTTSSVWLATNLEQTPTYPNTVQKRYGLQGKKHTNTAHETLGI